MTTIGWIDFSPSHRDKVGAALDLLRPEGMVDELGLGSLRDGMANQMFPGVSTIQTKAKYFFIVPYILYDYQQMVKNGQARGKTASKYLEQREYEVMWQLAEYYNYQDNFGVIGVTKRKPQKIMRRPSAIYWNGINLYRFLDSHGLSAEVFLKRAMKGEFESLMSTISGTDEPTDDADADHENIFSLKVFPQPKWSDDLTLDLSHDEAEIFFNNILYKAKGKLISLLLTHNEVYNVFNASSNFMEFVKAVQVVLSNTSLKEVLILAHDFSELMHGAHITYNCLIQQIAFSNNCYEENWIQWINNLSENMLDYERFDLEKLLTYSSQTRKSTVDFVRNWWDFVRYEKENISKRNELVEMQEYNVKRNKARLRYKKLNDVKEEKWVGFSYLEYRYRNARAIINDIKSGLANNVTS